MTAMLMAITINITTARAVIITMRMTQKTTTITVIIKQQEQ